MQSDPFEDDPTLDAAADPPEQPPGLGLGVYLLLAIPFAPAAGWLLQWAVAWSNQLFGFAPPIPGPHLVGATLIVLCTWVIQGVMRRLHDRALDRKKAVTARLFQTLNFGLLTVLYAVTLPAPSALAAAAVTLMSVLQGWAIHLAFFGLTLGLSRLLRSVGRALATEPPPAEQ